MNILIIGLGYAGTRFLRAFQHIASVSKLYGAINISYVCRQQKKVSIPYYQSIAAALSDFKPNIIVVSVNDLAHFEILASLKNYTGFIICEKPLLTPKDDLEAIKNNLRFIKGFCFDLIERYSDATIALKNYIIKHKLKLLRANFVWGKDRINDHRPTCGVTSEIIHGIDLIQNFYDFQDQFELKTVIGTQSDFSISGDKVLDSISLVAHMGEAVVTAQSSFVKLFRNREIDLVFTNEDGRLIFSNLKYDMPTWDVDHLIIWDKQIAGDRILYELHTDYDDSNSNLSTIRKLLRLVTDVLGFVANGKMPSQRFPDLETAISLQRTLNLLEQNAILSNPVCYFRNSKRERLNNEYDLERLG